MGGRGISCVEATGAEGGVTGGSSALGRYLTKRTGQRSRADFTQEVRRNDGSGADFSRIRCRIRGTNGLQRALKIEGRVLGFGHTDYANTMYHLGMVLYLQGKEKDSEALLRESIRILEENGLGETITCVRRMRYLTQMLLKSERLVEAENLQRKILHVLEISKGWNFLETIVAAEGLAMTLQSLERLEESQELLERCLDARRNILPHSD